MSQSISAYSGCSYKNAFLKLGLFMRRSTAAVRSRLASGDSSAKQLRATSAEVCASQGIPVIFSSGEDSFVALTNSSYPLGLYFPSNAWQAICTQYRDIS